MIDVYVSVHIYVAWFDMQKFALERYKLHYARMVHFTPIGYGPGMHICIYVCIHGMHAYMKTRISMKYLSSYNILCYMFIAGYHVYACMCLYAHICSSGVV